MLTPIIVIVSLFLGAIHVSKKIESPESKAEREAYYERLEARDPAAMEEFMQIEAMHRYEQERANSDIESFQRIPIQK